MYIKLVAEFVAYVTDISNVETAEKKLKAFAEDTTININDRIEALTRVYRNLDNQFIKSRKVEDYVGFPSGYSDMLIGRGNSMGFALQSRSGFTNKYAGIIAGLQDEVKKFLNCLREELENSDI